MSDNNQSLSVRLTALKSLRAELQSFRKTAFMAAPPMPGGGGQPPMDPSMMGGGGMPPGGMPPGGMPPGGQPPMDPSMMGGGQPPMDPAMMGGGMPPGGQPPMDPAMMGGGMPPGGQPPMDPSMMGGGQPPAGGGMTPEMIDELLGVIEGLAASAEESEKRFEQMEGAMQESMAKLEDLEQRLASVASMQPGKSRTDWR